MAETLISGAKIWGEGEYENAQGWARFGKWLVIFAIIALAVGASAAVFLTNQDIFNPGG